MANLDAATRRPSSWSSGFCVIQLMLLELPLIAICCPERTQGGGPLPRLLGRKRPPRRGDRCRTIGSC